MQDRRAGSGEHETSRPVTCSQARPNCALPQASPPLANIQLPNLVLVQKEHGRRPPKPNAQYDQQSEYRPRRPRLGAWPRCEHTKKPISPTHWKKPRRFCRKRPGASQIALRPASRITADDGFTLDCLGRKMWKPRRMTETQWVTIKLGKAGADADKGVQARHCHTKGKGQAGWASHIGMPQVTPKNCDESCLQSRSLRPTLRSTRRQSLAGRPTHGV